MESEGWRHGSGILEDDCYASLLRSTWEGLTLSSTPILTPGHISSFLVSVPRTGIPQLECSRLWTSIPPACKLIFPTRTCGPWEHSLGRGLFRINFPMFRKMILRFTHIVTCLSNVFHFSAEQYFIVWLSHHIFIQTSVDEHLRWLRFGTMIINLLWPFLCMISNGCMFSFD